MQCYVVLQSIVLHYSTSVASRGGEVLRLRVHAAAAKYGCRRCRRRAVRTSIVIIMFIIMIIIIIEINHVISSIINWYYD